MKSYFLQPRFSGARFTEHTLPLEVARDLAAYETLVVELAKHIYIKEHQDRQRVPKGFAADFHLHLARVDSGSAMPLLSVFTAGMLALAPGEGTSSYFERARDLISECVAAPVGQLPAGFPRELLSHFNQIGRSLHEDEQIEWQTPTGQLAVLSPARRKHLVLAADKVYEREIELSGSIGEADWERSTFRLRLADGASAVIPMPGTFHSRARENGGNSRHQVIVKGIATYDSWDKLQKVVSVDSLEVQPDYQLANRFEELRSLEAGWHDGHGKALDKTGLDLLADRLVGHYPERLPLPVVVPTPQGNLLLEWSAPGDPSLDLDLASLQAVFHAFNSEGGDIEAEFHLADSEEWPKLFSVLASNICPISA